jgi:hypothetical protein
MVLSGLGVAVWATLRDVGAGGDGAISLFFGQLVDMALFATLATAALLTRRRPEVHKRLILMATLAVLGAAVGRIPILGGAANWITFLLLATVAGRDLFLFRRLHRATLWGGLLLVGGILVQTPVGETPWWLSAGRRILGVLHYQPPAA